MADSNNKSEARLTQNPMCQNTQTSHADYQNCALLAKAIDTAELAQAGFNDLGALCRAIRNACEQHTQSYHLAGIGLYLADDWTDTLDGELETLAALKRPHQ